MFKFDTKTDRLQRNWSHSRGLDRAAWILTMGISVTTCDRWTTKASLYNSVDVFVTARDGSPVPGASLTLFTGDRPMGYAATNETGRYTFARVPRGVYGIAADPPEGFALRESLVRGSPTNTVDGLQVAGDALSPVRFTFLKKGSGSVSLRVAQNTGAPLAGVVATLYTPTLVQARVITDATGRASFNGIPFGVYGVAIDRPVFFSDFPTRTDGTFATYDDIIIDAGSRDSVTFTLQRCAGNLRALAIDQNNLPVSNANISFYTAFQLIGVRPTGNDGRATSEGPCDVETGISIAPPSGYTVLPGRNFSFFDSIRLASGQTVDVTFRLQRAP